MQNDIWAYSLDEGLDPGTALHVQLANSHVNVSPTAGGYYEEAGTAGEPVRLRRNPSCQPMDRHGGSLPESVSPLS